MCQPGSRKCAADSIDIDQLYYLNAECPFWVFNIYFYGLVKGSDIYICHQLQGKHNGGGLQFEVVY